MTPDQKIDAKVKNSIVTPLEQVKVDVATAAGVPLIHVNLGDLANARPEDVTDGQICKVGRPDNYLK